MSSSLQEMAEIVPAEKVLCSLEPVQGQDDWTQTETFEPIEKSELTCAGACQPTSLAVSASSSCRTTRL